jgi:hypothetical protein
MKMAAGLQLQLAGGGDWRDVLEDLRHVCRHISYTEERRSSSWGTL